MSIYTKTGDGGTTAVFGGRRISKADIQIEAYGSVDELTSFIGLLISKDKIEAKLLTQIQISLYQVMAVLSGAKVDLKHLEGEINKFEQKIDLITKRLPKLHRFILPQGGELASLYHVTRTVCRRAERRVSALLPAKSFDKESTLSVIKYLNRLSDLFFTLARKSSKKEILA